MRRSVWKFSSPLKNRSLSATLSFILSTALIFLPVLPVSAFGGGAAAGVEAPAAALTAPGLAPFAPLAPSLTATKVDSFDDSDGDGKAEPGDIITYTVTVTNNGTEAANVAFSDTPDPNTTLVDGSVRTQPIAAGDSYDVLGNVRIQPGTAQGLLKNDCDPDNGSPCSSAGLVASGPTASAQGGDVAVNADGSFSYNPPAGFEGTDTFTYTVTDATGQTDTATATLTVNDVVWFVNNAAATNGDGRLTSPFNSLAPLGGASDQDEAGDVIFVHEGNAAYGGGIELESGQRLVGQGTALDAALTDFGINAPPHSDPRPAATGRPTLTNAGGSVITLAGGNTVAHLNASASAASSSAIFGSGLGGATAIRSVGVSAGGSANGVTFVNLAAASSVTGSTVACNSSGTAVLVNGGSAGITFNSTSVSQNGGRVVYVHNRTGGAVAFDGSSTVTGTNGTADAVTVVGNSGGASVAFAAAVQLNTAAPGARGLVADGGGASTLNLSNAGNAVSSTGGAAVDIQDLTASVNFATTFSNDSNGRGLRVQNVTGAASFGNTAVNNSAGTGVELSDNTATLTFSDLDVAPAAGQRAVHATGNTGRITSASGVVTASGAAAVEVVGPAGRTPLNLQLTSVSSTGGPNGIVLQNTSAAGSPGGFRVLGTTGNCTPADSSCTGGRITGTAGADGTGQGVGVLLQEADSVSLSRMRIDNHANFAVSGTAVNGFALGASLVDGTNGNSSVHDEAAVSFRELTGTASITNSFVGGGHEYIVDVRNTGGSSLDRLTISNSVIGDTDGAGPGFGLSAVGGDDALHLSHASGVGLFRVTVAGSTLNSGRGDVVNYVTGVGVTSDLVFRNNTVHNAHPSVLSGGGGVTVLSGGAASAAGATYDISCNSFRGAKGHALVVVKPSGAGHLAGTVFGNVFGVSGAAGSSSAEASGINLDTRGEGSHTVLVKNNVVNDWGANGAIQIFNNQGSAVMNATVVGNRTDNPHPAFGLAALYAEAGALSGDTSVLNLRVGGGATDRNDFREGDPSDFNDVLLSRIPGAGTQFNLSRGVSAGGTVQQVISDNNVTPVTADSAGLVNIVTSAPALPPAVSQDCTTQVALNAPAELPTTGGDVQVASAQTPAVGFSAGDLFATDLASLALKARRGLAYSDRARSLRLDTAAVDAPAFAAASTAPAASAAAAAGTVNVQIGTLGAGDSVTITFQVKVAEQVGPNSPFSGPNPQVSNQGTVTADGGVSVQTDDPDAPGTSDPTLTPILVPPTVDVNDASVAEPATGTASALFTVSLSHAYTGDVTVNFSTAPDGGGANPATAGDDYEPTTGSVTFSAGQTVQTVSVPVNADGVAGEGDETFLVNLSGAAGGFLGDAQAVGTIRDPSVPSPVIISELRTSGPGGSDDDFVELLNTTDNDVTVDSADDSGWSIVKSGEGCPATPVVVGVIPEGTVIPARGNYLLTGTAYSLGSYAAGDAALTADVEDDRNVGLFTTAELANISSATLYDAVGFGPNIGNNCDLLREGTNLPAASGSTSEHSFVRKVSKGLTQDTGDNAADFVVVSTTPSSTVGGNTPVLGAPGPEGRNNPRGPVPCSAASGSARFGRELLDPTQGSGAAPNVVRDATADSANNSTLGTLDFRRTFTNNTGGAVTALRFRVINLSTFPAAAGSADLRARGSSTISVATASGNKTVRGTTLGAPPAQPNGGGVNSSLAAGTVTLATPLAAGASVNLRFLFGVEQVGDYDIAFVIEASTAAPGVVGKDFWRLNGNTEGGHHDRGCNRPPVANAGADQTAECAGGEGTVTLVGSASNDPDGDTPLTYEWSEGGSPLGTGETLAVTLPLGSHTVTLKVTDPAGDSSEDTVVVNVVDTTAPVVTAPPAVIVYTGPNATSCDALVAEEALGTATAEDGCQGPLPVTRTGVPAGNVFPVGTTIVTYSATDAAGKTGTATQAVTVVDNTKPVVTPPADLTRPNDPDSCSALVSPGTATATDNCAGVTVVGTRADNQALNAPYPVGSTTITWKATDAAGNTAEATQTVTVNDTQAPRVTSSVAVTMMGEPFNHALINVGLAGTASDNCPGLGPLQVSVYSDEDDGIGAHSPDAFDVGLLTLRLRRERNGYGDGRVYLVVVKATDAYGNTAASCRTVTVPLSNSAAHVSAVNAQAGAAASFCSANNGAAPSGYFVVGP